MHVRQRGVGLGCQESRQITYHHSILPFIAKVADVATGRWSVGFGIGRGLETGTAGPSISTDLTLAQLLAQKNYGSLKFAQTAVKYLILLVGAPGIEPGTL